MFKILKTTSTLLSSLVIYLAPVHLSLIFFYQAHDLIELVGTALPGSAGRLPGAAPLLAVAAGDQLLPGAKPASCNSGPSLHCRHQQVYR
jgi:hypothetical protein